VPAFFAFGGEGDIDLGAAMTMASVVASYVIELISFVIMGGEATQAFLAFFNTIAEAANCFFLNSTVCPLKARPIGFRGFIPIITKESEKSV
jgi:hypothetical protein